MITATISALNLNFDQLRSLSLNADVHDVVSFMFKLVNFHSCNTLTELSLKSFWIRIRVSDARDSEVFDLLIAQNPMITKISIAHCSTIGDTSFSAIATHCKQLKELVVNTAKLTTICAIKILQNCRRLQRLELHHCRLGASQGDIFYAIQDYNCHRLNYINIEGLLFSDYYTAIRLRETGNFIVGRTDSSPASDKPNKNNNRGKSGRGCMVM